VATVFDRAREGALSRVKSRGNSVTGAAVSTGVGAGTNFAGKQIAKISDLQKDAVLRGLQSVNSETVLGRAVLDVSAKMGYRLKKPSVSVKTGVTEHSGWTGAPIWGGLTEGEAYQLFSESAMLAKAWKNLFSVTITENRASFEAATGVPAAFSLLATDVTFAPYTAPGETVQVGGANIDHVHSTDRVEMQITTMDDARGSIKRWFEGKAEQVAHKDGTFGIPRDYLVTIRIAHMDPKNQAYPADRFKRAYLMRPASISVELSRRDNSLEELQMSFVEFDTFMKA
jgi:predicted trehalose synthase